jgi:RHS repeat-associated protein
VNTGAVPATRTGTTSDAWHGSAQRGYEHGGGLNQILMGARSYLPELGIFTATDPIEGGNTTTYAYPQDPINHSDLSGLFDNPFTRWVADQWDSAKRDPWGAAVNVTGAVALGACIVASAGLCGAVSLVAVGASMAGNGLKAARGEQPWGEAIGRSLVDVALSRIPGARWMRLSSGVGAREGAKASLRAAGRSVGYTARHSGRRMSFGNGMRNSWHELQAHIRLHPVRYARRAGYNIAGSAAGSWWG